MGQKWAVPKHSYFLGYAEYSVRGLRMEMEDAFVADVNFGKAFSQLAVKKGTSSLPCETQESGIKGNPADYAAVFGVFDGHSGGKASEFVSRKFAKSLFANSNYPHDPETALQETFLFLDAEFLRHAVKNRYPDGSTGVVALILADTIYVANAGDSRGYLSVRFPLFLT